LFRAPDINLNHSMKTGTINPRELLQRTWPALVIVFAAVLLMLPMVILGIPKGGDLPNHFHFALPFYDELRAGNWHPGWLADSNWGYGDPRFRFYPPGLYYLLAGMRLVTGNWFYAAICTFAVLTIIGGLGAYLWARHFSEPKAAMLAGVLYLIAPYHINELYQASFLSEYAACAVLPFAFLFVERICRHGKARDIAGLSAAYAALVVTHLPLTVIGSLALLAYSLIRLERKIWAATLMRLGLSVALGLGASIFFWGTMLAELKWIKGNSIAQNPYYDYRLNFVFSPSSLTNLNNWFANLLGFAMIGFLLPAFLMSLRMFRSRERGVKSMIALTFISFLMATSLSYPLWKIIPKLSEVQFPWRWLAITSLTGSVLLAMSLPDWFASVRQNFQPRKLAVALVFALSLVYVGSILVDNGMTLKRPAFEAMLSDLPGALSHKDWLPVTANDLQHIQKMQAKVEAGDRVISVTSWNSEHRTFHIAAGTETTARLWTYYYPHWKAFTGGRSLPVAAAEDGSIQVTVPSAAADIEVVFQEPRRSHVAAAISLISWLAIAMVASLGSWRRAHRRKRISDRSNQSFALIKPSLALE
jgi:6-pyruvoyl-tetrahydropterin synthase related domain